MIVRRVVSAFDFRWLAGRLGMLVLPEILCIPTGLSEGLPVRSSAFRLQSPRLIGEGGSLRTSKTDNGLVLDARAADRLGNGAGARRNDRIATGMVRAVLWAIQRQSHEERPTEIGVSCARIDPTGMGRSRKVWLNRRRTWWMLRLLAECSTSAENGQSPRSWLRALAAADLPTPPRPSNSRQQGWGAAARRFTCGRWPAGRPLRLRQPAGNNLPGFGMDCETPFWEQF